MRAKGWATVLLGSCLCTAFGQSSDAPNRGPVQAELLKRLNVRNLTPGDTVFARVTLDWNSPECDLRQGAILEARVETADLHRVRSNSRLALSFTKAQCNGSEMAPLNLVLAAVADTPLDYKTVQDSQFRMPLSFSNPHGGGMLAGFGSAAAGDLYTTHLELMGVIHRFPMTPKIKPGDVLGFKGMKLDIGSGPNRSSMISAKEGDVSLGAFTQLLLVPASLAFLPDKPALNERGPAPSADPSPAPASAPPPPNNFEVCAPPGCAVDLPVSIQELQGHRAGAIAAHPLGYAPRSHKILGGFDDEETLAWLGPNQLLFAFNPHPLIRRTGVRGGTIRIVRAVLLDVGTHNILRAVDWEIGDSRRYLWPLDGGRILVHVGNELRVYGAGLEMQRSIPLAGPLAFVQTAPNGSLLAVGTLRERHSEQLHAKLREDLASEPEEDVTVAILDRDFNTIASTTTISGLMPPTLLNEGQVKLLAQPNMHYRLAMSDWASTTTTLARFESACTPRLASMAPDYLFLQSCSPRTGDTEYRVVQRDGKLFLRGKAASQQIEFEASGNERLFAVKLVHALRDITPGSDFTSLDLDTAEVRVYRAGDGKRLLAIRVNEPATSRGTFALSPDGAQLAILSGSQIRFFPVPAD